MTKHTGSALALLVLAAGAAPAPALAQANTGMEIPRCTQNIGTVVVVESQGDVFGHMGMDSPAALLRHLVRESGCFSLIQRAPGATAVAPRMPEFAISAELVNEIDIGDGRTGLLGMVSRNPLARSTANVLLESSTGGLVNMDRVNTGVDMMHDGRLDAAMEAAADVTMAAAGGVATLGGTALTMAADGADAYNRAQGFTGVPDPRAQGAAIGARMGGRVLSSMGSAVNNARNAPDHEDLAALQAAMPTPSVGSMVGMMPQARMLGLGPRRSDDELLARGVADMQKDIERGRTNAEIEMSVVSIPLGEVVGETRGSAGRDQMRRQRIANNPFGGRVGPGFETKDEGKVISMALVQAYADMVTRMGGMGSSTPEITLATRDAVRTAEEARQRQADEAVRMAAASRPAPRPAARPARPAPQRTALPASSEVLRGALLRNGPAGQVIAQLSAGDTVYPTGEEEDGWREIEDNVGNIGWVQGDRLIDLD